MTLAKLPEDQAAAKVISWIDEALAEFRALAVNAAARGLESRADMVNLTNELERLRAEFAADLMEGNYGETLARAGVSAIKDIGASLTAMSRAQIEVALYNAEIHVKDLLSPGVKVVQETIANAVITGKDPREISAILRERLTLGEEGAAISKARADQIARGELVSVYRQASRAAAEEEGFRLYRMTGPLDDRTTTICREYLGQEKTAAEWEEIEPLIFMYGLHHNCRHSWDPVAGSIQRGD